MYDGILYVGVWLMMMMLMDGWIGTVDGVSGS